MNSISQLQNYKHDITGKFAGISSLVQKMDSSVFVDPGNCEIFHAIHEVLIKMVQTSRETILEELNQSMVLCISSNEVKIDLPQIQIKDLKLRWESAPEETTYYYFNRENSGPIGPNIDMIKTWLPIKTIRIIE